MPWKLILFLISLVVTIVFIGFNLDYSCDVNLLFTTYTGVPVFLVILISFALGALITSFFFLGKKLSKNKKVVQTPKAQKTEG